MGDLQNTHVEDIASDALVAQSLIAANVNLNTGFATNFVNHYIEILLLVEMIPAMPECMDGALAWEKMTYREHVLQSGLAHREVVLKAYDSASENQRAALNAAAHEIDAVVFDYINQLKQAFDAKDQETLARLAADAKGQLTPMIEHLTSIINAPLNAPVTEQDPFALS